MFDKTYIFDISIYFLSRIRYLKQQVQLIQTINLLIEKKRKMFSNDMMAQIYKYYKHWFLDIIFIAISRLYNL